MNCFHREDSRVCYTLAVPVRDYTRRSVLTFPNGHGDPYHYRDFPEHSLDRGGR